MEKGGEVLMVKKAEVVLDPCPFNIEKCSNSIDPNRGISMIVYADPGVGKTTLTTTLPDDETLIINSEAGLGPMLGKRHSVWNILKSVQNYEIEKTIDEMYKYLRTGNHPFKYIAIDNLSELEQQLLLCLTLRRGKQNPEMREYGEASFTIKKWVHLFRDLAFQGITVVFNAWEFPLDIQNKDGAIITKMFPKIGKKIAPDICGIVDLVAHLEVYDKTGQRWLRIGPSDQYITKCQFQGLENGEPAELMPILKKLYAHDYKGIDHETA
jgi:phage nucleotide-binding protein